MDQECQQDKCELITISCKLSEKNKKGKWLVIDILFIQTLIDNIFRYLRNAATFKDIRAGENGLELFKVEKLLFSQTLVKLGRGIVIGTINMCCRGT